MIFHDKNTNTYRTSTRRRRNRRAEDDRETHLEYKICTIALSESGIRMRKKRYGSQRTNYTLYKPIYKRKGVEKNEELQNVVIGGSRRLFLGLRGIRPELHLTNNLGHGGDDFLTGFHLRWIVTGTFPQNRNTDFNLRDSQMKGLVRCLIVRSSNRPSRQAQQGLLRGLDQLLRLL